jgi:hypothetical protein
MNWFSPKLKRDAFTNSHEIPSVWYILISRFDIQCEMPHARMETVLHKNQPYLCPNISLVLQQIHKDTNIREIKNTFI